MANRRTYTIQSIRPNNVIPEESGVEAYNNNSGEELVQFQDYFSLAKRPNLPLAPLAGTLMAKAFVVQCMIDGDDSASCEPCPRHEDGDEVVMMRYYAGDKFIAKMEKLYKKMGIEFTVQQGG
jgi:hypothetical protein